MQVQVDTVKSHVPGTHLAHHRVEIGAVVVAQAAGVVDNLGNLQNVGVKKTHRIGVGEHQASGIRSHRLAQGVQIHSARLVGGNGDYLESRHGGRGGIGAMGRVRDENLGPGGIPPGLVVLADEEQAGVLPMGPGGGLEGHAVHPCNFTQQALRRGQDLQRPLYRLHRLEGVQLGKPGLGRRLFVDPGVVLHGAGAQRIESIVDPVGLLGQFRIVPAQVHLGNLRQAERGATQQGWVKLRHWHIAGREQIIAPAGAAPFKQQFHFPSTSPMTAMS